MWCLSHCITLWGTWCQCVPWLNLVNWLWHIHQTDTLYLCDYRAPHLPCCFTIHLSCSSNSIFYQGLQNGEFPIKSIVVSLWIIFICFLLYYNLLLSSLFIHLFLMFTLSQLWPWKPIQAEIFANDVPDPHFSCRCIFRLPEI